MFKSKTIWLFIGSAFSQFLTLITSFYIVTHVNATIFGQFSFFVAVASILGSVATLKFEQSIVVSPDANSAQDKFNLSVQTAFLLTLVCLPCLFLLKPALSLKEVFLVFILANSIVINACLQQIFLYLELHIYNCFLSISYAFFNLLFVYFLINDEGGLKISYTLAYVFSTLGFIFVLYKFNLSLRIFPLRRYFDMFKESKHYPKYIFPGAVLSILLSYAHPIIINYQYQERFVGLFSISLRILMLPTILVGSVVSGLFRSKISNLFLKEKKEFIYEESLVLVKQLLISAVVIFPILLYCLLNIRYFVKLKGWDGIEYVAPILSLYVLAQYFYMPISNIPLVCEQKKLLFKMNIYQFSVNILAYLIAFIFKLDFYIFLYLLSILMILFSFFACYKFVISVRHYSLGNSVQVD